MKHLLYILLFASVCISCRSIPPSVKTETEIKGSEKREQKTVSNDSLLLLVLQEVKKTYERVNSVTYDFTQTKTDYSAPDSAGKQHPTSTTETKGKVNSNTTEKSTTDEKVMIQVKEIKSTLDTIKSTVDYFIKQNSQTTLSLTWWQKAKQDTGVFALGMFASGIIFIVGWIKLKK